MVSKTCSKCRVDKDIGSFYKYSKGVYGRRAACKECLAKQHGEADRKRAKQWARDNLERSRAKVKEWRDASPERKTASIARVKAWRAKNPERFKAVDQAHCRKRTARKLQASPRWSNQFFMTEAYEMASLRSTLTGIKWHVDHIVPLRSKYVCGLHSEHNLQVIPASDNCRKSNKVWPNMPSLNTN